MAGPARRRATYDDILALPEGVNGELIDGELFVTPRPATHHAHASSTLGFSLGRFHGPGDPEGPDGGWWILFEPELHLAGDVLIPDRAGWRRSRMPRLPNVAGVELAPDWICEVLSPSTARLDRLRKMAVYARHGVGHAWLVDPLARLVEVYRLHEGHWLQIAVADEGPQRLQPFDAVELDPARWWVEDIEEG